MADPRIHVFVEQFNRGEFFTAHDTLEELWQEYDGEDRTFLQGLIQVAVALEHRRRGNLRGARGVLDSARGHLAAYPAGHRGFDAPGLLEAAARHIEDAASHPPPRLPDPAG